MYLSLLVPRWCPAFRKINAHKCCATTSVECNKIRFDPGCIKNDITKFHQMSRITNLLFFIFGTCKSHCLTLCVGYKSQTWHFGERPKSRYATMHVRYCTSKLFMFQNKNSDFCAPLTSFDWNEVDPNLLGTSSIDTTCTVWGLEVYWWVCNHRVTGKPMHYMYMCK